MKRSDTTLIFIVMLSSFWSCDTQPGDKDYVAWVRDYANGLHVKQEHDGFVFDVQYQPSEYVWMQRNGVFDKDGFAKDEQDLDQTQYYTLTISRKDKTDLINSLSEDAADKQRVLYYFSYLFQNDIQLEEGDKVLPCVLFHFERNGDMNGSRAFVLGFENAGSDHSAAKVVIHSERFGDLPVKIGVGHN